MSRYLLPFTLAALIIGDGYLCARWSGRWHVDRETAAAGARADQLPLVLGDWRGQRQQIDDATIERAGFSGYFLRRYENQRTHAVVNILLAWGRPGPLSVHTPEVCYGGAGFEMSGAPAHYFPDRAGTATPGEFWKSVFARKDSTAPDRLGVIWAWNKNGVWEAPDNPRWTFAGTPVLFKIYVTETLAPGDGATDAKDSMDFLRDFLPAFERVVTQNP